MKRWAWVGLALVSGATTRAQDAPQPQPQFVERVEVRIRSVLVYITDAKGKPLTTPPPISQLRATEGGQPVEILAVEPIPAAASESTAAPTAAPAGAVAASPPQSNRLHQYLYLDTSALNFRSMPLLTSAVEDSLPAILANGPLEIVGADPEPRVLLASTSDAAAIRQILDTLPSKMPGKQRLLDLRRDSLQEMHQSQNKSAASAAGSVRAHMRMAVTEEITLLRNSLTRLEAWAARRAGGGPAILYYANDGFDMDPVEIYRDSISSQDQTLRLEVQMLASEFGGQVPKMLARAESTLAGVGMTTVMLALGGTVAEFAGNAANLNVRGAAALRRPTDTTPVFYYARPTEPLRLVADATGGEVVTATNQLRKAVARVSTAYLVTFRARVTLDGVAHPFELTSTDPDVRVRSPRFLLTGTPEAVSTQRAARVLGGAERLADLPLTVSLGNVTRPSSGPIRGDLRVAANFAPAIELFEPGQTVRLRLSLAVDVGQSEPFTSTQDATWVVEGTSWRYQLPLTWPEDARRIAVVVEELSTGFGGSAVVAIPPAP